MTQSQTAYKTVFGSLDHFEKGGVQNIDDNVKNYAFSNCFEIASKAKPYEKVVFFPAQDERNRRKRFFGDGRDAHAGISRIELFREPARHIFCNDPYL